MGILPILMRQMKVRLARNIRSRVTCDLNHNLAVR